jgi:geranylgeranyl diphosphate synthase, type I
LERTRNLVEPVLRDAVAQLPAPLSRVAGYQFGWDDERPGTGGKGIRPALTVLSAEAVGGRADAAVRAAAAVELVHSFSIVHDDIMDGDTTRRHRPTVWALFGAPAATLAGDALLALALEVLVASRDPRALPAARLLSRALVDLMSGQAIDVELETRATVGRADYLAMASGKTAALIGCACGLGATAGGADSATVRRMHRFGHHLGLAFQMVDDLLGIWGDPAVTGKPARSDLRSKKRRFPSCWR